MTNIKLFIIIITGTDTYKLRLFYWWKNKNKMQDILEGTVHYFLKGMMQWTIIIIIFTTIYYWCIVKSS